MKRFLSLMALLCLLPILGATSVFAANPIVSYERIFSAVEDPDNRMWFRLYEDGQAQAYFPAIMQQAGSYQRQLSQKQVLELIQSLSSMTGSLGELNALAQVETQLRSQGDWAIEDADQVVITFAHADLGDQAVSLMAPDALARRFADQPEAVIAAQLDAFLFDHAQSLAAGAGWVTQ